MNYYNEYDKDAARWLRNLISKGLIPEGHVDDRSISEVTANDLEGYTQCHFFAGIGGWSLALQLAGWSSKRPVWTGSCPCQPFSTAGKGLGEKDERHLWPELYRLINEWNPATVFGEQVASPSGRRWLDGVRTDLEKLEYAVGCADLCAAGVGAPHIRQRLYWVGHSSSKGLQRHRRPEQEQVSEGWERAKRHGSQARLAAWGEYRILEGSGGEIRRIESSTEPMAHGVSERVVRLRGYGNAIVPQLAAKFIKATVL
jgi:DNA (cytosine-5)-methyltransferase 1